MHLKALDHGLIVLDPRIEFLSIDDLPTVVNVSISCGKNMFSYEICRSVTLPIPVMATSSDLPVVVQSVGTLKGIDQLVEVTFKYALLLCHLLVSLNTSEKMVESQLSKDSLLYSI